MLSINLDHLMIDVEGFWNDEHNILKKFTYKSYDSTLRSIVDDKPTEKTLSTTNFNKLLEIIQKQLNKIISKKTLINRETEPEQQEQLEDPINIILNEVDKFLKNESISVLRCPFLLTSNKDMILFICQCYCLSSFADSIITDVDKEFLIFIKNYIKKNYCQNDNSLTGYIISSEEITLENPFSDMNWYITTIKGSEFITAKNNITTKYSVTKKIDLIQDEPDPTAFGLRGKNNKLRCHNEDCLEKTVVEIELIDNKYLVTRTIDITLKESGLQEMILNIILQAVNDNGETSGIEENFIKNIAKEIVNTIVNVLTSVVFSKPNITVHKLNNPYYPIKWEINNK